MHAVLALAGKDIRQLLRDRGGLTFTFAMPVIFSLFFGTVFGGSGDDGASLPIAVVDEDGSEVSRSYLGRLEAASELDVSAMDREAASEGVRRGDLVGFVVLPEGFGAIQARLVSGQPTVLELGVDPGHQAEAALLEGVLVGHYFELLVEIITTPDAIRPYIQGSLALLQVPGAPERQPLARFLGELDGFLGTLPANGGGAGGDAAEGSGEAAAWQPLRIEGVSITVDDTGPANAFEISFPQGLVWGLIACTATFAIAMVQERTRGTLMRLCTAPISGAQILAGKALACFATLIALVASLFGLAALGFGVRPTSVGLFALSGFFIAVCFTGLMMLLGQIGRTERATGAIGWSVFMVLAMFGGGMLPLFFMPDWMQGVSHLSPIRWAVIAIEGAIWRDFSFAEMLPAYAVLAGIGIIAFASAVAVFGRAIRA